jgi:ribonuclease-3
MPKRAIRAEQLRTLTDRLGIRITNLELLDRALTHASIASEKGAPTYDYEALEFLGDAVLGLAVADHLLEHKPDSNPGEYSRLRAALVNRRTLALLAQRLGIAPLIRLGKGEELSGGRHRTALLADCLEALIGAVYLDQGWEAAREFVVRVTHADFDDALSQEVLLDHKSRLQHYCQAEHIDLPRFVLIRSEGPDHRKQFEVEVHLREEPFGRGVGLSKKEAEQNAARSALVALGVYIE